MTHIQNLSCTQFISALASKQPTPGGGGAAAMGGAIGMALGNMVGHLTVGKKKYAAFEDEIKPLMSQGKKIIHELTDLIDRDASVFKPLLQAYGLPRDNPEQIEFRKKTIQECSIQACTVPLEIMQKAFDALCIHERLSDIGSVMAISDVGCGVAFLKAALISAHLNVLINLKAIDDQVLVTQHQDQMNTLLAKGTKTADEVLKKVTEKLQQK